MCYNLDKREDNKMKNHAKTLLTGSVALLLLTACGSSNQQSKSTQTDTVESSQVAEETAETIEFLAKGEHQVGSAVELESHDIVLTNAETSTSSSSQKKTGASRTESSSAFPTVLDSADFIRKYDNSELDKTLTYQFDAEPFDTEFWGLDADGKEYSIYIKDDKDAGFILLTTEAIAKSIQNSKTATFTVMIDTDSTTYIDPVRVISATPTSTDKDSKSKESSASASAQEQQKVDLHDFAAYLEGLINDYVAEYQVVVYKKDNGGIHIVFPQDIKYESKAHLQEYSDAMLNVYRLAFYNWVDEQGIEISDGISDIPKFYMDAEDGTRIAEYSVLSGTMKVKLKN